MKIKYALVGAAAGVVLTLAPVANASVLVNQDGTGFIGKGDVQLPFGWNNKALQDNAAGVTFRIESNSTTVTEKSWICTNSNNEKTQERERTTTATTSTQALLSSVSREIVKGGKQGAVNGFNLNGFAGDPVTESSQTTDGPRENSCPEGPWSLTTAAGDPEEISSETSGGVYAKHQNVEHQIA